MYTMSIKSDATMNHREVTISTEDKALFAALVNEFNENLGAGFFNAVCHSVGTAVFDDNATVSGGLTDNATFAVDVDAETVTFNGVTAGMDDENFDQLVNSAATMNTDAA